MSISDIENFVMHRDRSRYDLFAQQGNEPTEADILAFERRIGFRLPAEFREFALHPLGGLYIEVKEELWPSPKKFDVGPAWTFWRGFMVYALSSEAPDWLQLIPAWEEMEENGYPQLVPFLKILGNTDLYCFTREGHIVRWHPDDPDDLEKFDGSFSELVVREFQELEERVNRKLRGGK